MVETEAKATHHARSDEARACRGAERTRRRRPMTRARLQRRVLPDRPGAHRRAADEARRDRAPPAGAGREFFLAAKALIDARADELCERTADRRRSRRSTSGDGEGHAAVQAVGIDVGGTKTAAARIGADGTVLALETLPTPADDMDGHARDRGGGGARGHDAGGVRASASRRRGWWSARPACCGSRRTSRGATCRSPRISERRARPAGRRRQRQHGRGVGRVPVRRGSRVPRPAARRASAPGSAAASSRTGRLFRGAHGFAAEIGHIVMDPDGPLCGCGNRGCWEQFASGQARHPSGPRGGAGRAPQTIIGELSDGDPDAVTGPMVTGAARDGDAVAVGDPGRGGPLAGRGDRRVW